MIPGRWTHRMGQGVAGDRSSLEALFGCSAETGGVLVFEEEGDRRETRGKDRLKA